MSRQALYREALGLEMTPAGLFASSGLCAPLSPVYQLYEIEMTDVSKKMFIFGDVKLLVKPEGGFVVEP